MSFIFKIGSLHITSNYVVLEPHYNPQKKLSAEIASLIKLSGTRVGPTRALVAIGNQRGPIVREQVGNMPLVYIVYSLLHMPRTFPPTPGNTHDKSTLDK